VAIFNFYIFYATQHIRNLISYECFLHYFLHILENKCCTSCKNLVTFKNFSFTNFFLDSSRTILNYIKVFGNCNYILPIIEITRIYVFSVHFVSHCCFENLKTLQNCKTSKHYMCNINERF